MNQRAHVTTEALNINQNNPRTYSPRSWRSISPLTACCTHKPAFTAPICPCPFHSHSPASGTSGSRAQRPSQTASLVRSDIRRRTEPPSRRIAAQEEEPGQDYPTRQGHASQTRRVRQTAPAMTQCGCPRPSSSRCYRTC